MKILVVGSGGREHAIAWRLAQDEETHEIYCAPGNAGTVDVATNVAIKADDIAGLTAWAEAEKPDLVVVGPEAPLVAGLVDALEKVGVPAFGPVAAGARMEGSKRFAKEIMDAAGVPTGKAEVFTDAAKAKAALPGYGLPVVVKADGLAAGKGVIVAETLQQAETAIDDMLVANKFGAAGAEVLLEEFLHGEECSILAMVDGENAVLLPSSQDHKRIFDGDKGPNTGGMGAYSPAPVITSDKLPMIKEKIILPVVRELKKRGVTYRGILYAGLMVNEEVKSKSEEVKSAEFKYPLALSGSGINVVEFNARFGDPETEAVLPRLGGSFATALLHAATGCLRDEDVVVRDETAATVIVASGGYPGAYEKGRPIEGISKSEKVKSADDPIVFHCGTKFEGDAIVTSGGRVLSVTGLGANLREAVDKAYARVKEISFEKMFYRTDIAHRAFERMCKSLCVALAAFALSASAAIEPATLINDNMVLQRDRAVPIWGKATAGNEIKVSFAKQSKKTVVAADGTWRVNFDPMAADAEGKDLVITESKPGWFGSTVDRKTFSNVVVGEVWLCGGQSNMTFAMWPTPSVGQHAGREMNGYYDLALTREPSIRGVQMPCCWSAVETNHAALTWKPFVPGSDLGNFSAAAWHFALRLKTALGIPVGVIECAWGGSCIETWIPPFAYAESKSFKDLATKAIPTGVDKKTGKPLDSHQSPRACWNAMVCPLAPYAIRGAIWYQGCSNRGRWQQYYEMLETLRAGWGKAFECGPEMPLFICQITPFDYSWGKTSDPEAADDGRCQIREEMERWGLDHAPLAGCVNISDVGELDCIHPGDKRTVGTRLAAMALNRIYQFKGLACDAPVFRKAVLSKDGKKVTLSFDNVKGWCRKGLYKERFELAGADGKYVPVACSYTAKVPTVELTVPDGLQPKKVAYLRKSCVHSFLKNEAGIPLGPFRGDVTK